MYASQAAVMSQMMYEAGRGANKRQARTKYDVLRLQAKLGRLWAKVRRQENHPLSLAAVHPVAARYGGVQTVRLAQVRGSEGRCADLDTRFRPLHGATKERWLRVADAHQKGIGLPPVALVQVGDVYYVRDGHHRVSVALAWGQESIEAEVVVWTAEADASLPAARY
ncbi:MAG: hypothetical protein JXA93_10870 [Anaerolineae bacterium]|nr:hypothetical protein [Anaerolineae bacterium]